MAAKDITARTATHVALIMDGNGRWATSRGWPRLVGHRRGADRVRSIVKAAPGLGIRYLTIFAFSTENWKRSTEEVIGLMSLFARYIQSEADKLHKNGVRVKFIGGRERLEPHLQELMAGIEDKTRENTLLTLTIAINYGGRDELARAAARVVADVNSGVLSADSVDEAAFGARLDTADLPDPDLVIRTSGETRISNFLLWQCAYSEYEFTETLWPDFTADELGEIVDRFSRRERRFGGVVNA